MADAVIHAVGRRKTSVARLYLRTGTGKFVVNKKPIKEYFPSEFFRFVADRPVCVLGLSGKYDVSASVRGGGVKGQAESISLALARALCMADDARKSALRREGFLTRDSRMVERKKYGRKKARKKFQFSKR